MELKLRNVVKEEVCKAGSNCTFMELKCQLIIIRGLGT